MKFLKLIAFYFIFIIVDFTITHFFFHINTFDMLGHAVKLIIIAIALFIIGVRIFKLVDPSISINKSWIITAFYLSIFLLPIIWVALTQKKPDLLIFLVLDPYKYALYVFVSAAFEELIFRGWIFNNLLQLKNNIVFAIVISSILFALTHYHYFSDFFSSIPKEVTTSYIIYFKITFFGVLMAITYYLTRSLLLVTIIHFIHNIMAKFYFHGSITVVASIVLSCVLIYIIKRTNKTLQFS